MIVASPTRRTDHNLDSKVQAEKAKRAEARRVKSEAKRKEAEEAMEALVLLARYPSRATADEVRTAATQAIAVIRAKNPRAKVPELEGFQDPHDAPLAPADVRSA